MNRASSFAAALVLGLARALVVVALVLPMTLSPASAQFAAQSTWIATPGGTVNAITLAVANWNRNYPGVPINFLPSGDNTTAVTISVNGVGSPIALMKPGNTGLAALTGGELRSGQWASIGYDGTEFVLLNTLGQFVHASDIANSALAFGGVVNLQINGTVSTNALTIALKTASGADPTATTPILIPFRDSTIANGDPVVVPVVAATGFTIASGSTMGCTSAKACRLWIVAINNGGTVNLCAFNALSTLSGTNVGPIDEAALQTSASGTSGGNSAQTYYCNSSAVTAKAIRIIGYVEITETVAGTWATGPTYTQLFGPGIKKPGDVVRTTPFSTTTQGSTTSASFIALTSGQTASYTQVSPANVNRVTAIGTLAVNSAVYGSIEVVRGGSVVIGNPVGILGPAAAPISMPSTIIGYDYIGVSGAVTYAIYGLVSAGTLTYPQNANGTTGALIEIQEIMG